MSLKYYRTLYRKIIRLPLDRNSLERLRTNVRSEFLTAKDAPTYSVVDRKAYDKCMVIMDDILSRKYKLFHQLLDLVYKPRGLSEPWAREFQHVKYSAFKKVWPQVHVIDDFGDAKSINLYHQQLQLSEPVQEFSLMTELNMEEPSDVLTPLPSPSSRRQETLERLRDNYSKFHSFILKNATRLSGLKIQPMEIFYHPNRYGLPESVTIRESKLKKKINYAKALVAEFKVIQESDLQHLIQFIESDQGINPNFYRSSIRQKTREDNQVSPLVKKHVQHKTLVPNERNIKFYYRQYVEKQFFVNSKGDYEISPRNNFYK